MEQRIERAMDEKFNLLKNVDRNDKGALKMSEIQNNITDILNPVELAKQKRKALFDFYENIKHNYDILS